MRRYHAIAFLFWLAAILLIVEAKKGDDWNSPSNPNNNITPNNDKPKKNKKKPKKKDSTFETSLTFIEPQDLADPKLMQLVNSPWNDKAKREKLYNRLKEFAHDYMTDDNDIDKLVSRTRQEWEDIHVNSTMNAMQTMAKLAAAAFNSPGVQKFLNDREAQEKLRVFLIGLSIQLRNLLDDQEKQMILMSPDRWHALFEVAKSWQTVQQEQIIELLLNYVDKKADNDD